MMYQIERTVQQTLWQIHNWNAFDDSFYALLAVLIAYLFIVVGRDRLRI